MTGQIRSGNLVIAFIILAFLLVGLFTLYSGFLIDNDVAPDTTIEANINALYGNATGQAYSAQDDSETVSTQFDSCDNIFIRGAKVLDTVKNTGVIALNAFGIMQDGTGETQMPDQFYTVLAIIVSLLFVFAVAGALWRYDLI